jgi:hypothetical protein
LLDDEPGEFTREHLRITCDRPALEHTLDRRLREALESAPAPRRGRPRGRMGVGIRSS